MARCVYCLRTETETTFNREHVVPQFLGVFSPVTALLRAEDGLVCRSCNSKFSKLETIFKEDSEEGICAQQFNLDGSRSIRIRGKRFKMAHVAGFGESFLKNMFPFLKAENGRLVVDLVPQIQIRNYFDGYQVYKVDVLREIKKNPSKFAEIKRRLATVKSIDVSIFSGGNSLEDNNLNNIIALVKDFGISYKEGKRQFEPLTPKKRFKYSFECRVDRGIAQVLAKIVFNYFVLCALQEGMPEVLFNGCFNKIRSFINGDETIALCEIIPSLDKDYIMREEKELGKVLIAHKIVFEIINGRIIGRLQLFGKRVYEIVIGEVPDALKNENMGCGHLFNSFSGYIGILAKGRVETASEIEVRNSFGLFKKIR